MIAQAAVVGRRTCALLAACSAVLHGITIVHTESPAAAVLIMGMTAACLYYAWELWVQGELRTWVLVAMMNIAMIGMHTPFAVGHQHGGQADIAAMPTHSEMMTFATALAAIEAAIATAVVYQRSRHNRVAVTEAEGPAAAGGVARNTTRARPQVAVDG